LVSRNEHIKSQLRGGIRYFLLPWIATSLGLGEMFGYASLCHAGLRALGRITRFAELWLDSGPLAKSALTALLLPLALA
jgi:hypothetical protein